ncbi:Alpha/Beta hydrolase protein [Lophiotrema nucula]|uniref:Alpha/Beta hydrolase protein n=1 Tax=Lophiotrema nucula TaxID=690887 RepID=A0A6A5YRJ3_9PLEO|nr:Alpha/Beta hydrolase protein [Lophiotrema nucula]
MRLSRSLALISQVWTVLVATEPIVHLTSHKVSYRGTERNDIEHFQNIRFGYDTSGSRRFAAPEPYIPEVGSELEANAPGAACPQLQDPMPPYFSQVETVSEDCLNLRVARPEDTKAGDKLPVVVYVVGGGVIKGHAYDDHYDPENILKLSVELGKPIIYVAINYRLSIFGFPRLPLLKKQKNMNLGMRDQRLGLQWVEDNIDAFGGDPEKITAYGTSAGGTFISLHTISYAGEKGVPFTQAWSMSGPPGTALNMSSDVTELHTKTVAQNLGCDIEQDEKTLECLREVPVEKLLQAAMEHSVKHHPPAGLFTFIPSIDDDLMPERQSVLYRAGKFVKGIPMVFGWTQDDGATNSAPAAMFGDGDPTIATIKSFAHALTEEDFATLFDHYQLSDFEEDIQRYEYSHNEADAPKVPTEWYRLSRIMRDLLFTCSSIDYGFYNSKYSKAADPNFAGVRLYTFNQSMLSPLFKAAGMPYFGAVHGSDSNYIFNGVNPHGEISEDDRKLSRQLSEAFINFAYTGDPSVGGFAEWPEAFDADGSDEELNSLRVQVIGGLHGTGSAHIVSEDERGGHFVAGEKQVMIDGTVVGKMGSRADHERRGAIDKEKLFERCRLINRLSNSGTSRNVKAVAAAENVLIVFKIEQ